MLTIPSNARLFLYHSPVNMRMSFEGLSHSVEQLFPGELMTGAFFYFSQPSPRQDESAFLGRRRICHLVQTLGKREFFLEMGRHNLSGQKSFSHASGGDRSKTTSMPLQCILRCIFCFF